MSKSKASRTVPPTSDQLGYILVSGVRISGDPPSYPAPYPDYLVLRALLQPTVIDPTTVRASGNPLVLLAPRLIGAYWTIALQVIFLSGPETKIIATGEDVGLRIAFLAKLLRREPHLSIICHNIASRRPALFLGRLKAWTVVRRFHCLSRAQSRGLRERYGVPDSRIGLLLWHVDHEFFHPDPTAPARNQICSAGRSSRDYRTLIAAVHGLPIDLKIAADSPWHRQPLDVERERFSEQVEVRGYGSYAALRRLYAESLFVVVPLHDVPYSAGYTVILEAMAMGKAVIASETTQRDDFIQDGVTGYHVPPGNVEALRERIRFLLAHPEEAQRLGANGRASVEAHYTLRHLARRILS